MSLKKTREFLEYYAKHAAGVPAGQMASEALEELAAVERACRTLETESIVDGVYDVRDRAAEDRSFTGNTWEHPRVVAYGAAAQVIADIAKETQG